MLIAVGIAFAVFGLLWAYERWILPWTTRQWIEETLARIQSGDFVPPPKHHDFGISVDSTGIAICQIRPTTAIVQFMPWDHRLRIVAYKRDEWTTDRMCIALVTADTTIEVNEDMEGWETLTEAIPRYLPGGKPCSEWFSQVAFPACATNETVLFERRVGS